MQIRHYPDDEDARKEVQKLNAEDWMIEMLKRNPSYVSWGNDEDYMRDKNAGWAAPTVVDTWDHVWEQDELNEMVHGYFFLMRASLDCEFCEGTGLNPDTKQLKDDWYDFNHTGRKWSHNIGEPEIIALTMAGRLGDLIGQSVYFDQETGKWMKWINGQQVEVEKPAFPTPDVVNKWSREGIGHDAINHWICVKARAEHLGIYGHCDNCEGNGYVFTEPTARLGMQLWMIHPRKGAGRGLIVNDIKQADIPVIERYFKNAIERTHVRFAGLAGEK